MNEIINDFNEYIMNLVTEISIICPNSIISNNKTKISKLIEIKKNKLVELFIIYVLPDKEHIEQENDDYFINNSYKHITNDENDTIKQVFEFKHIWKNLNSTNKQIVRDYMKILLSLASDYFKLFDSSTT
jgi:hypothetical protein